MVKITDVQHLKLLEIHKGYNDGLVTSFMEGVEDIINACGDNHMREGLEETPFRVAKAFLEYTSGLREDPRDHLQKTFGDVPKTGLVMIQDIEFWSMCEHHFAPFFGVAHVGYVPGSHVTGLSKVARMIDGYAKRFQVQERLTSEIADAMFEELGARGVMVVVEAKHMCMCGRGVRKATALTKTSEVRGIFENDSSLRAEFLTLIKN